MVNSREIPSGYTVQWNAGTRQTPTRPPSVHGPTVGSSDSNGSQRKYCSSCNSCKKSRVKCSGGSPCQRCAGSSDPSACVYSVSQRRGKRKAGLHEFDGFSQQAASYQALSQPDSHSSSSVRSSVHDNFSEFDNVVSFATTQPLNPQDSMHSSPINVDPFTQAFLLDEPIQRAHYTPHSSDTMGILTSPGPSMSPFRFDIGNNSNTTLGQTHSCCCYLKNQTCLSRMESAIKEPTKTGLDKILQAFQDISLHIASYLACKQCDGDCPRLMNLAMLHQRQVSLLCFMTKNPATHIRNSGTEAVRFTLGIYQLSDQEDANHKRLVILDAARKVDSQVASFDDLIRNHQDKDIMGSGTSEMPESAKLNFKWLLDVARNLKSRLKVIVSILEKVDWALDVNQ
ncbi:hypothetical protein F4779DRAFT_592461 [Xylariaceae sp. FL0662B]|nr:hypothetical protein F4779DRAFT_592461 [Xylariaceae sp. FL0662B]